MSQDYTPQQVAELLDRGGVQVVDVRTPQEHEAGQLAELDQADSIERTAPVIFYCRSGSRSAMATEAFTQAGYDAHNMAGGMLAWDAAGLALEPPDGVVV